MRAEAYMATVDLDGDTLTVTPSNKASRVALLGQAGAAGTDELVLDVADIGVAEIQDPTMLKNGRIDLVTVGGEHYTVHYRRSHRAGLLAVLDEMDGRVQVQYRR